MNQCNFNINILSLVPLYSPFIYLFATSYWFFLCFDNFFFNFSERERSRSLYDIGRPSVCRLSVTFVRPTQAIEIFGNVSMPFGTPAIC